MQLSPQQKKKLLKLFKKKIPAKICAEKLAVSPKTIYSWLKKYNENGEIALTKLQRSNQTALTPENFKKALDLKNQGLSTDKIKKELNLKASIATINRYLRQELNKESRQETNPQSNLIYKVITSKIPPFTCFFQSSHKIMKNLFMIVTLDLGSDWFHLSFSKENSVIYKSITVDYLISSFYNYGIKITRTNFFKNNTDLNTFTTEKIKKEFTRLNKKEIKELNEFFRFEVKNKINRVANNFKNNSNLNSITDKEVLSLALIYQINSYNNIVEEIKILKSIQFEALATEKESQNIPYIYNLGSISPIFANKYLSFIDLRNSTIGYFLLNNDEIEEIYQLSLENLEADFQAAKIQSNNRKMLEIVNQKLALIAEDTHHLAFKTLHEKGKLLQVIGKWQEAEIILKELILISEKEHKNPELLEFLEEYAKLLHLKGLNDDSITVLKKAIIIAKKIKQHEKLAHLYYLSGSYLLAQNSLKKARKVIDKILGYKAKYNNKFFEYKSLNLLGDYFFKTKDYYKARLYFTKLRILAGKDGSSHSLSCALGNLGIIYQLKSKFKQALSVVSHKLEISSTTNNLKNMANAYTEIGNIYFQIGQSKKATKNYHKAEEIARANEYNLTLFQALTGLGSLCLKEESPGKALGFYNDALFAIRKTQYKEYLIRALYNLGRTYYKFLTKNKRREEDLEKCQKFFTAAYNLHLKLHPDVIDSPLLTKIHDYLKKIF